MVIAAGEVAVFFFSKNVIYSPIHQPTWGLDAPNYHRNSESWLNATRYGNVDYKPDILTDKMLEGLFLLGPAMTPTPGGVGGGAFIIPLSQSVALHNSKFLTWGEVQNDEARTANIDAHRLLYLAIHEHHHRPARAEAMRRFTMYKDPKRYASSLAQLRSSGVGRYDYECRDAKFLVGSIDSGSGIGHAIRKKSAPLLLAGLNSGRVVAFVNNINGIPSWGLASCDRHDLQCFFMPTTPCVLTEADLMKGTIIGGDVLEQMLIEGQVDDDRYKNARILIVNGAHDIDLSHARHRQTVHQLVREMYDNYTDLFSPVMSPSRFKKAEAIIQDQNELWKLEGAAASFILRPNLIYNAKLKDRMGELFPRDFDTKKALGIPIRCKNLLV